MSRIAVMAHAHYAIRQPYSGGLEMHTAMLVSGLIERGHDVTLFAKGGSAVPGATVRAIVPEQFTFAPFPKGTLRAERQLAYLLQSYRNAMREVSRGSFDYVINNSLNAVPLEWLNLTPMLTIFHTPLLEELDAAARHASIRTRRCFATVSEVTATDWRRAVPHTEVVHNGVDLQQWPFGQHKTDELRWSARITPEKGLHVAIEAARLSGRALRIAGPISDQQYFDDVITPQLDETVEYVGHLNHDELATFLGEGAVALATPQWEEPFGLSVVEALACGTPVAALPRGAMREIIAPTVGAVSRTTSAASLAASIERAALCEPLDCRTYVHERFDADRMIDRYVAMLQETEASAPLSAVIPGGVVWAAE